MRQNTDKRLRKSGVSPVISIVLLVAIVVALAGLVTFVAFNFTGEDSDDSVAGGAVDFTATTDGVEVTLLRMGDANNYTIKVDGENLGTLEEPGDVEVISAEGLFSVVGNFGGSQEVIAKKRITGVISGLFTVIQDSEDGTVEAQLLEKYEGQDEYELAVNSENDSDATTSYEFSFSENGTELLSDRNANSRLLAPEDLPSAVPNKAANIIGITAAPDKVQEPATVGDKIQVHKLLGSWCEGDELLLVGEDGENVLDGDVFQFDNNCGGMRTVPTYSGSELTGAKIVNLWEESVTYSVFAYEGEVEPPKQGTIESGSYKMDIEVFEKGNSDNKIEDSDIVVGNKAGTTNNSGRILFNPVPASTKYFLTVNAGGYEGTQAVFNLSESSGSLDSPNLNQISDYNANYNVNIDAANDTVDINIGLEKYTPDVTTIKSGSIEPDEEIEISYSSTSGVSSSPSTNIGVSSGGGSGTGFGGGYSNDGGSISTATAAYSATSSGSVSTQTLSTSSAVVTEEGDYTPQPSNPSQDVDEDPPTEIISEPQRVLNVIPIDDSLVPTGEEIKMQVSAQTYADQSVNETIRIYKAKVGENQDPTRVSELDQNLTLPPGEPGNEQTESIRFEINSTSTNGAFQPGEKYVIYAALESNGQLKEAGTIDVFNGELTKSDISLDSTNIQIAENADGQSTTRKIGNAIVGDKISITINSVVAGGATPGETIDLFRNGELVKRVEDYSGGEITYTEELSKPQYIDYHVGIKESQNTTLIGTAVVSELDPEADSPDDLTLNPDLSISNSGDCDSSNVYDCEIQAGSQSLKFDIGGTFEKNGQNISDNVEYTLVLGDEDTRTGINYGSQQEHTFSDPAIQLVELKAEYEDSAGNNLVVRDTLIVNAYTDKNKMTSYLAQDPYTSSSDSEEIVFDIQSNRSTVDEVVNLTITSECTTSCSDNGGSYKIPKVRVQEGVQNLIKITVPELAWNSGKGGGIYTGSTNETYAVSQITNENGDVPLNVEISSVSVDGQSLNGKSKSYAFQVGPKGQIDANISASIFVNQCPQGTDSYSLNPDDTDPNFSDNNEERFFCNKSTCESETGNTCEDKLAP